MAWIRSNKKQSSPGPTPPTYENYIYNVGTCAFNTGYIHKANTKIRMKAVIESWKAGADWQNAFGACKNGYGNNALIMWSRSDFGKLGFSRTGSWVQGGTVDAAETSTNINWQFVPCIFTAENNTLSWYREEDPLTVRSLTTAGTVNEGVCSLAIFNCNQVTTEGGWSVLDRGVGYMRLFWFEIYEDNTLLHRFIPAYNNNQWCLYDEIDEIYIYDTQASGANLRGWVGGT